MTDGQHLRINTDVLMYGKLVILVLRFKQRKEISNLSAPRSMEV